MTCELWQQAISARIDDEDLGVEPRLLEAHLATCADCRRFEAVAEMGRRTARMQVAAPMPDLSKPMTKLNAAADRAASWSIPRILLAVIAADVFWFAIRDLLSAADSGSAAHDSRHLGAFSIAYAVGLVVVVVRPARARTMLPVAAVLAGALLITAVIDLLNGNVPLLGEATHLPELISVFLIWLLAVPSRRRADKQQQPSDRRLHAA